MTIGEDGTIAALEDEASTAAVHVDILLPAPGNLHSHSFQRAMAGMTEYRARRDGADDFWSWRELMYRFLNHLDPDDLRAIAAQAQMEMLEAGYAAVGEFHYVHHQPGGGAYDNPAEMTMNLFGAAEETGIGYTHLPVLYMRGGLDDRPLIGGQLRFGCDLAQFEKLFGAMQSSMKAIAPDFNMGVAPHSLRAVNKDGLSLAATLSSGAPLHIHIAEQLSEVEAVRETYGATPVRWLLDNADINERWCLVHATHASQDELRDMATAQCIVGLCPITEANLGDGVFPAEAFAKAGGRFGVGSDSNVRIALTEELRLLEYGQRLTKQRRAVLSHKRSCGRLLFDHATQAGAQALGRNTGRVEPGALADLVALDCNNEVLFGAKGDDALDAWIFAGDDRVVSEVWAAGRHVVREGRHYKRDAIAARFRNTMTRLRNKL